MIKGQTAPRQRTPGDLEGQGLAGPAERGGAGDEDGAAGAKPQVAQTRQRQDGSASNDVRRAAGPAKRRRWTSSKRSGSPALPRSHEPGDSGGGGRAITAFKSKKLPKQLFGRF